MSLEVHTKRSLGRPSYPTPSNSSGQNLRIFSPRAGPPQPPGGSQIPVPSTFATKSYLTRPSPTRMGNQKYHSRPQGEPRVQQGLTSLPCPSTPSTSDRQPGRHFQPTSSPSIARHPPNNGGKYMPPPQYPIQHSASTTAANFLKQPSTTGTSRLGPQVYPLQHSSSVSVFPPAPSASNPSYIRSHTPSQSSSCPSTSVPGALPIPSHPTSSVGPAKPPPTAINGPVTAVSYPATSHTLTSSSHTNGNYPLPHSHLLPSATHRESSPFPSNPVPPAFPPLPPNPSDEDYLRCGAQEILRRLRKAENEMSKLLSENSNLIQEVNKKISAHANEVKNLKDANQRLVDDNQELRDLCCFLDDDRQKGRKLAREWQRFGRYTASVMRQEVSAYQTKLRDLERKQEELVKDNLELKELCLYLDEERHGGSGGSGLLCTQCNAPLSPILSPGNPAGSCVRDEGDGSSSSTNADEGSVSPQQRSPGGCRDRFQETLNRQRSLFNEQILQYIRNLEYQLQRLRDGYGSDTAPGSTKGGALFNHSRDQHRSLSLGMTTPPDPDVPLSRPEAVVQAMKVLKVHEQLEKGEMEFERDATATLGEGEKALLREMCNVVWRKLEDAPAAKDAADAGR